MTEIFKNIVLSIKNSYDVIAMLVFLACGLYLLIIDGTDLSTKNLKWELKTARVLGVLYIVGSIATFIIFHSIL